MTRLTKLYFVVTALLLITLSVDSYAFDEECDGTRPRVPRTNWENSMGHPEGEMCIILLADNVLRIHLYVGIAAANMDANPVLRVEYDWGGYISGVTSKITNGDLVPTIINGYNAFEAKFTFTITVNDKCSGPNPPSTPWPFLFEYRLVTPNIDTRVLEDYPVVATPELFPAYMFPEVGKPNYTPVYTGDKFLCCATGPNLGGALVQNTDNPLSAQVDKGASIANDEGAIMTDNFSPSDENEASLKTDKATIFPNPVNDVLNIDLTIGEGAFYQVDLIDINGAVVKSIFRAIKHQGKFKEVMDISTLSKGIYFCRIKSAHQLQTHKVIKL